MMGKPNRLARARSILTWKHWVWTTGVAVLVCVVAPLQGFDNNSYWAVRKMLFHMPWFILFGYLFLFAIAFVEAGSAHPTLRRYAGAALAAGALCVWTAWSLASLVQLAPLTRRRGNISALPKGIDRETNARFNAALSPAWTRLSMVAWER
jgi:hypothetical protein